MTGALIVAFVILVVLPVTILMSGAVVAGLIGWTATDDAKARHVGSELVDLS